MGFRGLFARWLGGASAVSTLPGVPPITTCDPMTLDLTVALMHQDLILTHMVVSPEATMTLDLTQLTMRLSLDIVAMHITCD